MHGVYGEGGCGGVHGERECVVECVGGGVCVGMGV